MINESYLTALKKYSKKYGYYSIATLLLKYFNLLDSIELEINSNNWKIEKIKNSFEISASLILLKDHYNKSSEYFNVNLAKEHVENIKEIKINGILFKQYNKAKFFKRYSNKNITNHKDIIYVNQNIQNLIINKCFYVYAINKDLKPVIYRKPIPLKELILGKRIFNITHPELVFEDDLITACAGEVIFIKGLNSIEAVILNNKSGHFQPSINALEQAKLIFSKSLNLEKEKIFIIPYIRKVI